MGVLDNRFEKNFMISLGGLRVQLGAQVRIWPLTFGLACCAIEMIASSTSRFDIARFGAEVFRPSPRQSDLMIVAGTVTLKMAPVLKRIWDQMPDPKWCISMGACSSVGGPFNTYAVLQGVDKIVPVDVYVIGCPPRPENLFYALLKLQDKIDQMIAGEAAHRSAAGRRRWLKISSRRDGGADAVAPVTRVNGISEVSRGAIRWPFACGARKMNSRGNHPRVSVDGTDRRDLQCGR